MGKNCFRDFPYTSHSYKVLKSKIEQTLKKEMIKITEMEKILKTLKVVSKDTSEH